VYGGFDKQLMPALPAPAGEIDQWSDDRHIPAIGRLLQLRLSRASLDPRSCGQLLYNLCSGRRAFREGIF